MEKRRLKVLSLFTGAGGTDIGFEGGFTVHYRCVNEVTHPGFIESRKGNEVTLSRTRFDVIQANDILEEAREVWINNFNDHDPSSYVIGSVVELVKRQRSGENIFQHDIDVVTGSFPCCDFSVSGKREGFCSSKDHEGKRIGENMNKDESRGTLYKWMKEVIEITRPKVFVAENVKGLVSLGNVKEIIQDDFEKAGYVVVKPRVLHCANYGVAQSRERVIFIGIRKDSLEERMIELLTRDEIPVEVDPYPLPSHSFNVKGNNLMEPVKVREILEGITEPECSKDPSQVFYSRAKFMGKHCQGQSEVNVNGLGPTIRAEHHGNIEFRRLSLEHGGKHVEEINMGMKERRLTPRECAIIQSFPGSMEFVIKKGKKYLVSPSMAYRLIGNAVPPLLAYHISRRIEELWEVYFDH